MEWLEASLAFVVTMMILSTIASMVVETVHRMLRLREKGLEQTLDLLFKKVIWPKVAATTHNVFPPIDKQPREEPESWGESESEGKLKELRENFRQCWQWLKQLAIRTSGMPIDIEASWRRDFVNKMTGNEFSIAREKPKKFWHLWMWLKWLAVGMSGTLTNEQKRRTLSTLEMAERLAETAVGQHISQRALGMGTAAADQFKTAIVVSISDKFEDFSEEVRDIFSRQARLLSVVVGFVLAFSLNVDAAHLFKSYLRDPALRTKVIAQGDAVAERLQEAEKSLQEELSKQEAAELEEVKKGIDKLKTSIADLEAQSIPISWDNAPVQPWFVQPELGQSCFIQRKKDVNSWDVLLWFLSVTLGGFLIGLGGPFWFDSFRKLSALTGVARQFTSPAKQSPDAIQESADSASGQATTEEAVVTIFKRAERSQALNKSTKRQRVLLGQDGTVDRG